MTKLVTALIALAVTVPSQQVWAQPAAVTPAPADAQAAAAPAPVVRATGHLPEGYEVKLRLDDNLSSKTSVTGDTFSVTTSEPLTLSDGTVIPAGYRGKGEVSSVEKSGMIGRAGQLNVRLDYIRIGDAKVALRATQSSEGKSNETTTVVLTVLLSPLFLLMHGKEATIPKGQAITAYVDSDVDIAVPVTPPPAGDD